MRIHVVYRRDLLATIAQSIESGRPCNIGNVNTHAMNLAFDNSEFRDILNAFDLVFVDGFGVKLAAKLAGLRVGERLTYMDWTDDLFRLCAERRWPIFVLGDTEEVGQEFQRKLLHNHPDCPFAGRHHGFFEKTGQESEGVVRTINRSGALVLLAGMSMPVQENWIWANREVLAPPVRLTSGAFFSYYSGFIPRGPKWMTQHGLEWLHRLAVQPRAMWRRYLLGNPLFLTRVLVNRFGINGNARGR
ncbi:MAG: WecB/TagA/CpsF family glycosyltransferase [Deltaproteobacteria bacterium]|nr:WecB/TagA/CpsF family glycosyltransferase [Deltaproteobacteria bacterium]